MHLHYVTDDTGDTVDVVEFCSDACHRDYTGDAYDGWSGCHEAEFTTYRAACGVALPGLEDACEHQRDNVVVNRFTSEDGERCEHGRWVQLPAAMLPARDDDTDDGGRGDIRERLAAGADFAGGSAIIGARLLAAAARL